MDKLAKARRAVIETPRLRLMACDADLTAAILEDKSRAECFLNADLHCEWPGDDTLGFLPFQDELRSSRSSCGASGLCC